MDLEAKDEEVMREIADYTGIPTKMVQDVFQTLIIITSMRFRESARPVIRVPLFSDVMVSYKGETHLTPSKTESEVDLLMAPTPLLKKVLGEVVDEKKGAPYKRGVVFKFFERRLKSLFKKIQF